MFSPILIDTHTHFDEPVFDDDRDIQLQASWEKGIRHLLLVGYVQRYFQRLLQIQADIQHICMQNTEVNSEISVTQFKQSSNILIPQAHVALGLHPFYIEQHKEEDLHILEQYLANQQQSILAVGEIGLDTFTAKMKQPDIYQKQQQFFTTQLDLAVKYELPVLLHIRKAHADCLKMLKYHQYDAKKQGGIAHSFSGGEQEAKAFVKLGFKLGVTGQITNPNAKKLRRAITQAVAEYGLTCLVIETDCPDMLPVMCQNHSNQLQDTQDSHCQSASHQHSRNVPANLVYVLQTLSELLVVEPNKLAEQLWKNSCQALQVDWQYPS